MVGIFGTAEQRHHQHRPALPDARQCGHHATGGSRCPDLGTALHALTCPAGQAVTGVVGGQGAVLDSVALVCGVIPPAGPAITSVEPIDTARLGNGVHRAPGHQLRPGAVHTAAAVVVTNGGHVANGFILRVAVDHVRRAGCELPAGFPLGPATVRLENGRDTVTTNAFPDHGVRRRLATPVIDRHLRDASSGTTITNAGASSPRVERRRHGTAGHARSYWTQGATVRSPQALLSSRWPDGPSRHVSAGRPCATVPTGASTLVRDREHSPARPGFNAPVTTAP